jgi:hypothetical protein
MKMNTQDKQKRLFELIDSMTKEIPNRKHRGNSYTKAIEVKHLNDEHLIDPRTGAKITHVHTTVLDLIKISDLKDNFFQRKLQNHMHDKIYKNLIISILQGHLIPELRVAALNKKSKLKEFDFKEFKANN